ncbi:MAG TPA: hypothetical protein VJI75_04055 [Candidatus Nanoarchaeia archaeon]|nr:hypothetical protein [Candidatus Nanoarchaeia archaeon]
MQCPTHGKHVEGTCQWCGKLLCKLDIAKTIGKKLFCKHCSRDLSDHIVNRQFDQIRKERETEEKQKSYSRIFGM